MSESKLARALREYLESDDGPPRDRARRAVYAAHEFLVILTYSRFIGSPPRGIDSDEVIQLGRIALWECIEAYTSDGDAEFITYAMIGIRNAMTKGIKSLSWCRAARVKEWNLTKVRRTLEAYLGRTATYPEIARALGVTVERLLAIIREVQYNYPVYLEGGNRVPQSEEGCELKVIDTIVDPCTVEMIVERREAARQLVHHAECVLVGRELQVFYLLIEQASPTEVSALLDIDIHEANEIARRVRYRVRVALADSMMLHLYEAWAEGPKRRRPRHRPHRKQAIAA